MSVKVLSVIVFNFGMWFLWLFVVMDFFCSYGLINIVVIGIIVSNLLILFIYYWIDDCVKFVGLVSFISCRSNVLSIDIFVGVFMIVRVNIIVFCVLLGNKEGLIICCISYVVSV